MTVEVAIINAFTKDKTGGNPAAVVLDADRFSSEQKQAIAAKVGLSETAFVGDSTDADFKLDFFTPTRQISHCGHATIATFSYLKQSGEINGDNSSKMTIDGRREIRFVGEEAYMEQTSPRFFELEDDTKNEMVKAVGLSLDDVVSPSPILINTGNSFAIIEVKDEKSLQSLTPQFDVISTLSNKYNLIGFYIFRKPESPTLDATTRMFAPAYGIEEESATGMAAGPLACYLFTFGQRKNNYHIEQGKYMRPSSPSLIKVDLVVQDENIIRLYAGGTATLMNKKEIEI